MGLFATLNIIVLRAVMLSVSDFFIVMLSFVAQTILTLANISILA